MAIRNILTDDDPMLRKKARVVERIDRRLLVLIDDMVETMKKADGVGLAAPQVGILKRVVVIDTGESVVEMINPEIIETEGEITGTEACLSLPGQVGMVPRPARVRARYLDRTGKEMEIEGEELLARAICHETDHLNGVLFIDRAVEMLEPEDED